MSFRNLAILNFNCLIVSALCIFVVVDKTFDVVRYAFDLRQDVTGVTIVVLEGFQKTALKHLSHNFSSSTKMTWPVCLYLNCTKSQQNLPQSKRKIKTFTKFEEMKTFGGLDFAGKRLTSRASRINCKGACHSSCK